MITLLDGKNYAKQVREEIKKEIDDRKLKLKLVVIQVGDDKASSTYVKNKSKACKEVGIDFEDIHFNQDVSRDVFIDKLNNLNTDDSVNGILIQQPVPKHLRGLEQLIIPEKDVDGFTYINQGKLLYNEDCLLPCTPNGIINLLEHYHIDLDGKNVVMIGRSNIVGKPLSQLLLNKNATVITCHSHTRDLKQICHKADIIISAIGKPRFIDNSYLGTHTDVIIDVGINRDEDGNLCGDCDFKAIYDDWSFIEDDLHIDRYRYITPVPGGVGPLTIAFLLKNVLKTSY